MGVGEGGGREVKADMESTQELSPCHGCEHPCRRPVVCAKLPCPAVSDGLHIAHDGVMVVPVTVGDTEQVMFILLTCPWGHE